eukprot:gene9682-12952_t
MPSPTIWWPMCATMTPTSTTSTSMTVVSSGPSRSCSRSPARPTMTPSRSNPGRRFRYGSGVGRQNQTGHRRQGSRSSIRLIDRLDDASALVRGAAAWALSRLDHEAFTVQREARLAIEPDPEVLAEWASPSPGHVQQLQPEHQHRIARDGRWPALGAIGELRRQIQQPLVADLHQLQGLGPAGHHVGR